MPGRWPTGRGSRPWVSRPTARPAERTGKSSRASNLKSQPVAFGISRPTRTTTEVSTPTQRWKGRRPRAGLQHSIARERPPAKGCPKTLRMPAATPPCPRPASPRTRPGSCSRVAGETRIPGDGPEITSGYRGPQPAQRGRKWYWDNLAGREVELATTGRSRRSYAGASAPYHGTLPSPLRLLNRTEPANHELGTPRRPAQPRSGSDFRINVPGDDPTSGAGATSE
jgi:hypothetical protein